MGIYSDGYIQIYTGDGKGKTTASLGVVMRTLANNGRVFYGQFLKGRKPSSEFTLLNEYSSLFVHRMYGTGHFVRNTPSPEDITKAENGLRECTEALSSGEYDLVVMDELNGAVSCGVLQLEKVINAINLRNSQTELIITGRNAPQELIEIADLVTDMRMVKHYFEKRVTARKGIEC